MSIHSRYDESSLIGLTRSSRRNLTPEGHIRCEKCRNQRAQLRISQHFCIPCLQESVPRRIRDAMVQSCAIPRYQRAILAYSGGRFSTFLLAQLMYLRSIPMDPRPWLTMLDPDVGPGGSKAVCYPQELESLLNSSADCVEDGAATLNVRTKDGKLYARYQTGIPLHIDVNAIPTADILKIDPNPDKSLHPLRLLPIWIDERPLTYAFAGAPNTVAEVRELDAPYLPKGIRIVPPAGARAVPSVSLPCDASTVEGIMTPQLVPNAQLRSDQDSKDESTSSIMKSLVLHPHVRFIRMPGLKSISADDIARSRAKAEGQKRKHKKKLMKGQAVGESGGEAPANPEDSSQLDQSAPTDGGSEQESQGEIVLPILVVPIGWPNFSPENVSVTEESTLQAAYRRKLATLRAIFLSLPTSTDRQDFIAKLVRRQLIQIAARLDCPRILVGDTLSSMAVSIIQSFTKGNGVTPPANAGYTECVFPISTKARDLSNAESKEIVDTLVPPFAQVPVFIHRPMRDLTTKLVAVLLHMSRIPYAVEAQLLSRHDLLSNGSINRLSESFLVSLERGNDLTAHNVVRTMEKVRVPGTRVPGGRVTIPDYPFRDLAKTDLRGSLLEELETSPSGESQQENSASKSSKHYKPTTPMSFSAFKHLLSRYVKAAEEEKESKDNEVRDGDAETVNSPHSDPSGSVTRQVKPKGPDDWQGATQLTLEEIRDRARERGRQLASQYMIPEDPESSEQTSRAERKEEDEQVVKKQAPAGSPQYRTPLAPTHAPASSGCCGSTGSCGAAPASTQPQTCCSDPLPKPKATGTCCRGEGGNAGDSGSCESRSGSVAENDEDDPGYDDVPSCGRPVGKKSLTAIRGRGVQAPRAGPTQVITEKAEEFLEHAYAPRCVFCGCDKLKTPPSVESEIKSQSEVRGARNNQNMSDSAKEAAKRLEDQCCMVCSRLLSAAPCSSAGATFPNVEVLKWVLE